MKVAIIGASGKSGRHLVEQALERGHEVVGICREKTAERLAPFEAREGFSLRTAPVVSDKAMLSEALAGCDAVIAILISIRKLKATDLVRALVAAMKANGVTRLVCTAGEITAGLEPGEQFTRRQRVMKGIANAILFFLPISMTDMIQAAGLIEKQADWDWTIVRAPTLKEKPAEGYHLGALADVTGKHVLSRADYAACLLDSVETPEHHRRRLVVLPGPA